MVIRQISLIPEDFEGFIRNWVTSLCFENFTYITTDLEVSVICIYHFLSKTASLSCTSVEISKYFRMDVRRKRRRGFQSTVAGQRGCATFSLSRPVHLKIGDRKPSEYNQTFP
jgi:hypothetical protein